MGAPGAVSTLPNKLAATKAANGRIRLRGATSHLRALGRQGKLAHPLATLLERELAGEFDFTRLTLIRGSWVRVPARSPPKTLNRQGFNSAFVPAAARPICFRA